MTTKSVVNLSQIDWVDIPPNTHDHDHISVYLKMAYDPNDTEILGQALLGIPPQENKICMTYGDYKKLT